jgi:hypothetical protein
MPNIYVPPVPVKEPAEFLTRLRYAPDAQIYGRNAFYPSELVKVAPPAQFRQQTIVRVQLMPVHYNPIQRQLRLYRDLQIVVRFVGGASSTAPAMEKSASSPAEEEWYQKLLVNYEQAKAFRLPASRQLLRTAATQIDGPLYKFSVQQQGIYKIDGQTLRRAGITDINPSTIHLYNNGGRELPRDIRRARPPGLVENAIYVSDGGDGRFDENDFILFYGRGVDGFAFDSTSGRASHYLNRFGFDNFYWLSFGGNAGKRMAERAPRPVVGLTPETRFRDNLFVEEEINPLYESDQTWYGHLFTNAEVQRQKRYQFKLTDPVSEGTASLRLVLYAFYTGGFNTHALKVQYEDEELTTLNISGINQPQAYDMDKTGGLVNGNNNLTLTYSGSGDAAQLYIDYFELAYDRQLRLADGALMFNGRVGAGPFAYSLSNADTTSLWLLEVSDFSNVTRLPSQSWQISGSQVTFADIGVTGQVPRRYIAAVPSGFKSIGAITRDAVSNWRAPDNAADLIIITHEDFLSINPSTGKDEGPLAKFVSLRENYNPQDALKVAVVKIQDVFDEFSCGMYDPTAIRDFLKYAYDNWQRRPLYVMLVGDGDYDPKNIINKSDKNWIPTYHTAELDDIISRVTDSWFTYVAAMMRLWTWESAHPRRAWPKWIRMLKSSFATKPNPPSAHGGTRC